MTVSKKSKITEFAKTSFVIRTPLSLFVATDCGYGIGCFRVAVNTLRFFVTTSILCEITTYRQFISIVRMKVVTSFSTRASLLNPMNTNKFFALLLINVVLETLIDSSQIVDAGNDCVGSLGSRVLKHPACINVVLRVHF